MRKKWFLVGGILLLVSLLMAGCGVPQGEYDAVLAERDAAEDQVASLESDLAAMESDLDKTKAELTTANADLDQMGEQIARVSSSWSSLKPKVELASMLFQNMDTWNRQALGEITYDEASMEAADQWGRISVLLDTIGNEVLTENLRGAWFEETVSKKYHEYLSNVYSLLASLIEEDIESVSNELAP